MAETAVLSLSTDEKLALVAVLKTLDRRRPLPVVTESTDPRSDSRAAAAAEVGGGAVATPPALRPPPGTPPRNGEHVERAEPTTQPKTSGLNFLKGRNHEKTSSAFYDRDRYRSSKPRAWSKRARANRD